MSDYVKDLHRQWDTLRGPVGKNIIVNRQHGLETATQDR